MFISSAMASSKIYLRDLSGSLKTAVHKRLGQIIGLLKMVKWHESGKTYLCKLTEITKYASRK